MILEGKKIAFLGDFDGVLQSIAYRRKKLAHFIGRFVIKLIGFKPQRTTVCNHAVRLNAHHCGLNFGIAFCEIMDIIGCHKRYSRFS